MAIEIAIFCASSSCCFSAAKATMAADEHGLQQRAAKQPLGLAVARRFCIVKMNILATSNPYKRVE